MQNDTSYILTYSIFLSIFISLKIGGSIIIRRQIPISDNQDLFLLYLTYTVFDKMIMYKPIIYQEAQEYFLIGIGYKGLSKEIMDELKNRHTKYVAIGLIDITKIPDNFATQLYRCQEMFLNVFVEFIQNKIYFTNNYQKISENEWKILKQSSKSKIKDWIKNNFAEKMM